MFKLRKLSAVFYQNRETVRSGTRKEAARRAAYPNWRSVLFNSERPPWPIPDAGIHVPTGYAQFPREILPVSSVLSNLVHFLLALVVMYIGFAYFGGIGTEDFNYPEMIALDRALG